MVFDPPECPLAHGANVPVPPQGPSGPQGPIGYPGPRGVKVSARFGGDTQLFLGKTMKNWERCHRPVPCVTPSSVPRAWTASGG